MKCRIALKDYCFKNILPTKHKSIMTYYQLLSIAILLDSPDSLVTNEILAEDWKISFIYRLFL